MAGDSETRPWGSWHVIDIGPGYKVKRIEVLPNSRLSYQTHTHRSEHWVVIYGKATCIIDGVTTTLRMGSVLGSGWGFSLRPWVTAWCQPSSAMPASRKVTLKADHRKVEAGGRFPTSGSLGQLLV